jgi:hypothetical protein
VLTLAYVGTEGHRLITQMEANPGNAALCMQLTAQGATDTTTGLPGCGPNGEQDTFMLPSGSLVYGTRNALLSSNYCADASALCFGSGNTFTRDIANSIYNAGQITVERKAAEVVTLNPRKANPGCPTTDTTGCYFLPGAFALNSTLGTFGTANRRFFHGPGLNNTDFGLSKRTAIKEKMAFEIRGEFFNIFNHAQFINPTGTASSTNLSGTIIGNFGVVTKARDPRIGQISAKFYW